MSDDSNGLSDEVFAVLTPELPTEPAESDSDDEADAAPDIP